MEIILNILMKQIYLMVNYVQKVYDRNGNWFSLQNLGNGNDDVFNLTIFDCNADESNQQWRAFLRKCFSMKTYYVQLNGNFRIIICNKLFVY